LTRLGRVQLDLMHFRKFYAFARPLGEFQLASADLADRSRTVAASSARMTT
jgi:hypothetical protein